MRAAIATLLVGASIALVAACSSDEPTSVDPTLPAPGDFLLSADCDDLEYGHLDRLSLTLSTAGADIPVVAELADQPSERTQGLMCRESIPPGTGMYFEYPEPRQTGFWMFNTYQAIDILFINESDEVVDMVSMSPCLRGELNDDEWQIKCATEAANYLPRTEWIRSLELPGGWLESVGIDSSDIGNLEVSTTKIAD